jgi:uncharacterized protein (TIGR02147 family)
MALLSELDYRKFLNDFIKSQPKAGHGFKLKMAEALRVHPTLITQILKGHKSFTMEQGFVLTEFLKLNDLERDYFLTLIEFDKAGTEPLKKFIEAKLLKLRLEGEKVKNQVATYASMSEADQAIFYSHWSYSALRLSCDLGEQVSSKSLAMHLQLPIELVDEILRFLISRGLVKQKNNGFLALGPQNTFLPAESPLISRHHMNWRMKAIERHPRLRSDDLAFSAPLTIAQNELIEVRKMCLELIQKVSKKVSASPSETLACLNLDWFRVCEE